MKLLPAFDYELYEGVDKYDTLSSRARPRNSGVILGWKMNTGHWNRCLMAVVGAFFVWVEEMVLSKEVNYV